MMTGLDGRERDFSVPPGQVRQEWLKKQDAIAEESFLPSISGIVARDRKAISHSQFSTWRCPAWCRAGYFW